MTSNNGEITDRDIQADLYWTAPQWDDIYCPHTCEEAKPTEWTEVVDQRVIAVNGAGYRLARVTGTFLLSSEAVSRRNQLKEPRVFVYCRWFGHTIKSGRPIRLRLVEGQFEIIQTYSGPGISNLSAETL